MRIAHVNQFCVLFVCSVILSLSATAAIDNLYLKRAMTSKKVLVTASSLGGYCGRCINLHIVNTTDKDLNLKVDPGLIFVPEDTGYQNLVVWGDELFQFAPGETKDVVLETFCGKSYAACPAKNIKYTFWKQGDSNMIRTLNYARTNALDKHLVQSAVWTFTNQHKLSTIYFNAESQQQALAFVTYVARLTNKPVPDYFTSFPMNERPGEDVLLTNQGKVIVPVKFPAEGYKYMYVTIYKENGDVYRTVEADRQIDKNGVTVQIEFRPEKDLNGIYKIQAYDESHKVWATKSVKVETDYRPF